MSKHVADLVLPWLWLIFIYLFIKALQHKCWRSVGHQVLQPVKDVKFRTVCLKSCRQEKKSMMHQNSLEPAAIRFTLESLQESARRSGYFLLVFFSCIYIHRNPRKWLIILKYLLWNLMVIVLFIKALQHMCWRSVGHQVFRVISLLYNAC